MLTKVSTEVLPAVWPQCYDLLKAPAERDGLFLIEDVWATLITGKASLFIEYEGSVIKAAVVTEFVSFPRALLLRLWLMGATRGEEVDYAGLRALTEEWAKVNAANGLQIIGRSGWSRKFHQKGDCVVMTEFFTPKEKDREDG
jgi:hypothetical protein